MKKYYKSLKYKKYNKRHSEKLFKRIQYYKDWKRQKLQHQEGVPKEKLKTINEGYIYVDMPCNFTFLSNTSMVLSVINNLRNLLNSKKKTFINLKPVEEIDNGAITALLSIMTEYKLNHVAFNGNFPYNDKAKALLLSSGFFEHLYGKVNYELFSSNSKFVYGKENQIITKPGKNVTSTFASKICSSVSNTLGHKGVTSKGLYRTLIELMHNTNNHANPNEQGEELWWLTVHHDKIQKKVTFVFLDYGVGIFKSLRNKKQNSKWYGIYDKLKKIVAYGSDANILEKILKGEIHRTATDLEYRGKGLNGIYEVNQRKQISNLHIITNNVFANVSQDEYKKLDCEFNGTFVYWEIDKESEVNEWIQ